MPEIAYKKLMLGITANFLYVLFILSLLSVQNKVQKTSWQFLKIFAIEILSSYHVIDQFIGLGERGNEVI